MRWILWIIPENALLTKSYSDNLKFLKPSIPCELLCERIKPKVMKIS